MSTMSRTVLCVLTILITACNHPTKIHVLADELGIPALPMLIQEFLSYPLDDNVGFNRHATLQFVLNAQFVFVCTSVVVHQH